MDSYEEFFDEYVEFMTKLDEIDEDSLSDADLAYYRNLCLNLRTLVYNL